MMRVGAATTLALALLFGGCSGGSDSQTSAPAVSTTAVPVAACPAAAVAMPSTATDVTSGPGDFDGDGRADRLSTYRVGGEGAWRLRVELIAGGSAEVELPAAQVGVKALGGARLDVGTAEAAMAVVGSGAAGSNVGLFVLRSCRLERVTVGGTPAEFPVGSTATTKSGVTCQVPGLVIYSATTTDGARWQASSVSYLLLGTLLDEAHRATMALGSSDAALPAFGAFSCGSLRL